MVKNLAKYIDHTQLKPDATEEDILCLIDEAKTYQFASVCVNPYWVPLCSSKLNNSEVKVCTVIGFPLGAAATETKVHETNQAIKNGAVEVDMVINIGELKSGHLRAVYDDIKAVVETSKGKALTKVIIETALLSEQEKIQACRLAKAAGCDFVKTSTGFSSGGATVKDVQLMRQTVGTEIGVKASGGIRSYGDCKQFIEAGASRIGASHSVSIMKSWKSDQ